MGITSKSWTTLCAALGFLGFSQAPEFSQQYKQRINGGIAELKPVIEKFDADAKSEGLDREGALEALKASQESLPQKARRFLARAY